MNVSQPLTVEEICLNPQKFVGETVTLRGTFHSFRGGLGKLKFPPGAANRPQKTKSDWVIQIGEYGLYVTEPSNKPSLQEGQSIELQAKVAQSKDGVYLEPKQVTPL